MKLRVMICQQELTGNFADMLFTVAEKENPDVIVLPEYFFPPGLEDEATCRALLAAVSRRFDCILVGGSMLTSDGDTIHNTCYVYRSGEQVGRYHKVHLFHREEGRVTPGSGYRVFDMGDWRLGLMICADVLDRGAWLAVAEQEPDLVRIPTFSPWKEESDDEKFARDLEIFVKGAVTAGCPVVKVCGIGEYNGQRIQGRSLVALPGSIQWRVKPAWENREIFKVLPVTIGKDTYNS
jgi:predicted amidohydrolase